MRTLSLVLSVTVGGLLLSCCFLLGGCDRLWGPELRFSPTDLSPAEVGQPYQAILTVYDNDTPVSNLWIESGSLPPGLTLTFREGEDAATISGTPEVTGTFAFVVKAMCLGTNVNGDVGEHAYALVVE
jgi:hypothetical protein